MCVCVCVCVCDSTNTNVIVFGTPFLLRGHSKEVKHAVEETIFTQANESM